MIITENYLGTISYFDNYIRDIVSKTVSECFGVAGLGYRNFGEFLANTFLGKRQGKTGIEIKTENNRAEISVYVVLAYGTNIGAVVRSIKNKVRFAVEEGAGIPLEAVNVYVDNIKL